MRSDFGIVSSGLILESATRFAGEDWSLLIDGPGCHVWNDLALSYRDLADLLPSACACSIIKTTVCFSPFLFPVECH